MTDPMRDAAWVLTATFTLSIAYELFRSTLRVGTSEHDTMRGFVGQLPTYAVATAVIAALFSGASWAVWPGLLVCLAAIGTSITYYNPRVLLDRQPALVDWVEDLVFTGLCFVAAAQLVYELVGR